MWIYNNKQVLSHKDLPEECTDIVYIIYFKDKTKYIGKKTIKALRKLKPTKKQLAIRKNYSRKEIKNLPFINYKGSSTLTKNKKVEKKEILFCCSDKRTATFLESYLLFTEHVLFKEEYLNKNILGKFYDNVLDGLLENSNELLKSKL